MNLEYRPNPKQELFHRSTARYRAFIGGIRSGKTYAGAWETLLELIKHPGLKALVVSPTYPILNESTLTTLEAIIPEQLLIEKHEQKHKWKLSNGSEILYRSADDPDSIRGMEAGWLWADELARVRTDEAWKRGIGRLSQRGMPCRAIITTTPRGMTWLYDEFVSNATPEHFLIGARTDDNRGNLPGGFIENLERQYSGAFLQQELYGQFVGFEGLVYPDFSPSHILEVLPTRFPRVIAGVDFGMTNPTVVLPIGLDIDGRAYVLDELYQCNHTINDLMPQIQQMKARYNISAFYADPSSNDLIEIMRRAGINAVAANNDILAGLMEVQSRLKKQADGRPRLFVSKRCMNTLEEFGQYRYADNRSTTNPNERPMKLFDHSMDALRYALMSCKTRTRPPMHLIIKPASQYPSPYGRKF